MFFEEVLRCHELVAAAAVEASQVRLVLVTMKVLAIPAADHDSWWLWG
jgi:hypothetical protein